MGVASSALPVSHNPYTDSVFTFKTVADFEVSNNLKINCMDELRHAMDSNQDDVLVSTALEFVKQLCTALEDDAGNGAVTNSYNDVLAALKNKSQHTALVQDILGRIRAVFEKYSTPRTLALAKIIAAGTPVSD